MKPSVFVGEGFNLFLFIFKCLAPFFLDKNQLTIWIIKTNKPRLCVMKAGENIFARPIPPIRIRSKIT